MDTILEVVELTVFEQLTLLFVERHSALTVVFLHRSIVAASSALVLSHDQFFAI